MNEKYQDALALAGLYIFHGLLVYMPFHILVSTWLGSSLDLLDALKVLKDVVLVAGLLATLGASVSQKWFPKLAKDKLLWLIAAYGVLTALLALARPTDTDAEAIGLIYNTRFLLFFAYALLLCRLHGVDRVKRTSLRIVISVAAAVLFFGILQYAVLPDDILTHLGYSRANGVLPAFFIDDKPDLERVMSTLRDPNSFGSYAMIIGSLAAAFLLKAKDKYLKQVAGGLLALSLLGLWFSFSRSAWLGFVAAMGVLAVVGLASERMKRTVMLAALGAVVVIGAGLFVARDSYFVKNVVFHADETTTRESPNELRLKFWRESVSEIGDVPLGHGPGTAGLASIRNTEQGTRLTENYYLQIGHEIGVIGLGLFLAILGIVGFRLYGLTARSTFALALLAAFAGLMVTNFLALIWSNEAVAYTWWGLAGTALSLRPKSKVGS
jgi:O-antigen ligase